MSRHCRLQKMQILTRYKAQTNPPFAPIGAMTAVSPKRSLAQSAVIAWRDANLILSVAASKIKIRMMGARRPKKWRSVCLPIHPSPSGTEPLRSPPVLRNGTISKTNGAPLDWWAYHSCCASVLDARHSIRLGFDGASKHALARPRRMGKTRANKARHCIRGNPIRLLKNGAENGGLVAALDSLSAHREKSLA